jgi:hypothetical protein
VVQRVPGIDHVGERFLVVIGQEPAPHNVDIGQLRLIEFAGQLVEHWL